MTGAYIHIPFCVRKCRYCDFPSYGGVEAYIGPYVDALCREIGSFSKRETIDTIYFGGGTPSLLTAGQVEQILCSLARRFSIAEGAEITLEANPDSLDRVFAAAVAKIGVNRVSIGIQSFQDDMLAFLGRVHTAAAGKEAVQAVWDSGIDNISIDLMYGLPGQDLESVADDIKALASLPVCHASIYSLIVEEHTPLWDDLRRRRYALPDDDVVDAMGTYIHEAMAALGFKRYEISSYARHDRRSRHNCKYWQYEPYVGFGASAHSFYDGQRRANIANIHEYIRRAGREDIAAESIRIDKKRAVEDYCFLALRMMDGIDYEDFARRFSCSVEDEFGPILAKLFRQGLLEKTERGCCLSPVGIEYGNYVFSQFIRE